MRHMPWDDIRVPHNDYNTRLAAGPGEIPVYWGRDPEGSCLLLIELVGEHSVQFRKDVVPVKGMHIDLRQSLSGAHSQQLVLTLERQVDRDIFAGLCETLVATLSPVTEPDIALGVVLEHLKRWKSFLSGRKSRLLSPEEVRGLFGELSFFRSLYSGEMFSESTAVNAWCGPEGTHHDFVLGEIAVEIKTVSGRERNSVRISSEDQLEIADGELFLKLYRLGEVPDSDDALSLNELVAFITEELADADAFELFQQKLVESGYLPVPEYDNPRLQVIKEKTYRVSDEFPRLVRSGLPEGVIRVSYELELEHIASFERVNSRIFER